MQSTPLYKLIQEDIRKRILSRDLRPGDRIPSESEMREHYYVSSITVRNALAGLVDEGLIYRIKGKGSFVAASPFTDVDEGKHATGSRVIGVVFPTMSTRVEQIYLIHLERLCRMRNYHILVGISRESPEQELSLVQDFIRGGVAALILFPTVSESNNALVRQLVKRYYPVVFIDRYLKGIPIPCVHSDNVGGAVLATEYLLKRCAGDIAICHFPANNTAVSDRLLGFQTTMATAGHSVNESNQCVIEDRAMLAANAAQRVELLYGTMYRHLSEHPHLKGLFAANAEIARVAHLVLLRMGRRLGMNAHLFSFDNPNIPGCSFILQDHEAIVRESANLLFEQIQGKRLTMSPPVPTQLVEVPLIPMDAADMQHLVIGLNP